MEGLINYILIGGACMCVSVSARATCVRAGARRQRLRESVTRTYVGRRREMTRFL
jgi:hypothetical protein